MTFIWPAMLLSLLLIPLLVVLYLRIQHRRQRLIANFSSLGFEQNEGGRRRTSRRHIPMVFFLVGLTILLLTLARPQAVVSLPRVEGTVLLVFDVSGSMAATDLTPTRMEAAKAAARNFVQSQPVSIQIGVVAFSDSGLSVQVPTNDQAAILAAIDRLSPANGTALANGILASLNTIAAMDAEPAPNYYSKLAPEPTPTPTPMPPGKYTSAVIVMLTDGENNEDPDPMAAAQAAADRGVRIYTVGIGSPAGTTIEVDGFTIHTQLNEDLLTQISQIANGSYYNAESQQDLLNVYDDIAAQLVIKPEKMEITSILVGVGFLVLLVGGLFSLFWLNRLP
jgi:Ca-activated chloride channel family protein